jgi:putative transposase
VLKFLGVSKSGFYDWKNREPSNQELRKEAIKTEIIEIHNDSNQIYGAPKITDQLRKRGHTISERTVSNYMKEEGVKAVWISPYKRTTIDPDFSDKLHNVLNRKFNPERPNAVWVSDITYIWTITGFCYLTSVMDLYSRKIIGWHLSDSLSTEGVIAAINKAKRNRKLTEPVVFHSDRGVQFVSKAFYNATPAEQFTHSYSRKGNPWDNACIEAFHSVIKREWLNRFVIKNLKHAHELIFEYIEGFYNTRRTHGACGLESPNNFEMSNLA